MRSTLPFALGLFLVAIPAYAEQQDSDAPDFRTEDTAYAYSTPEEAYAGFRMHFGKARAFFLVTDYTSAIKELEKAYILVRDPTALINLAQAYDERAEVEIENGEYQKARIDKRTALRLYQNASRAKLIQADHILCIARIAEVKKDLGKLREVDPVLAQLRKQAQQ